MTPQAAWISLAEKHGAISCFSRDGIVTLTITPKELKELVKHAIEHHKEQERVQNSPFVHRCV